LDPPPVYPFVCDFKEVFLNIKMCWKKKYWVWFPLDTLPLWPFAKLFN
jgi:hypothetical protein